jgi:hypothetical protein
VTIGQCLVVVGGNGVADNPVESLNTERQGWWALPNLIINHQGGAVVTLENSCIVVLGGGSRGQEKDVELLSFMHASRKVPSLVYLSELAIMERLREFGSVNTDIAGLGNEA